ncbi:MAG: hypothetical protein RJB26_1139 [Pseudomonadota bacterium]|jgi:hypothetical protein
MPAPRPPPPYHPHRHRHDHTAVRFCLAFLAALIGCAVIVLVRFLCVPT